MALADPQTLPHSDESRPQARLGWTALLHDWVTTVDHKKIGLMYVVMAIVYLVIGGCEAILMRWQLLYAAQQFLGPDTFNQLFTMHGTTMVFFMGMPILIGIGNYLVPLMIGARDMAFPRLNALGFWVTLFGRLADVHEFYRRRSPGDRLVRLRAVDGTRLRPRAGNRLLGDRTHRQRHRNDLRRGQFRGDHSRHARAGDDDDAKSRSLPGRCCGRRCKF